MREIRLCWLPHIVHHEDAEMHDGGLWTPDSPENRADYQTIMECANEVYGAGSHWIEEREA